MTVSPLLLLGGIPWTLAITLSSFTAGALIGLPLCAMKRSRLLLVRAAASAIVLTCRSVPPIVWLFFVFFGIGNGLISMSPFTAATIGLGLVTGANMAEIYRGALTAIHAGQFEACRALNLSRLQQFRDVILPQMARIALPSAATYLIGLLKDSAIASTIGVPELSYDAYHVSQQTFQGLGVYASAAVLYILISLPIAWMSRRIDLTMRAKVSR
ncbi:MAG: amino acid ABC transporter permease [Burkholderia sp.]